MAKSKAAGFIKTVVILGVLGGGGWYGWTKWKKDKEEQAKPQFNTAKIEKGDVIQQVTASGTLNPVVNIQVGSQISGQITNLHVDFNSKVKAGDLVAEIDSATYNTRLLQNEADLASAKANLQLAETNAKRAEQLFKENLISQADYDIATVNLAQAKAQVQTREAQVNSTKVDLERCKIIAPIDGIVIDRKVDVGQTVAASLNAPVLFMIANDLTKMQINASVSEADIGAVETNLEVKFTVDAFPGRDFAGKVTQVRNAPQTVQNVVSYDTIIEVDNSDGKLKPGMTANVNIITSKREGVVRIPNSALRFKPPTPIPAPSTGTNQPAATASAEKPAGGEEIPQTPAAMIAKAKELREKGEQMSDEMRAKFREMMSSGQITPQQMGFGGGGGPGGGGGFGGGKGFGGKGKGGGSGRGSNRPSTKTIYTVGSSINSTNIAVSDIKAVTIKAGISDGVYTEVLEGLQEGDVIVTGQVVTSSSSASRPTNPFSSGSPFGGRGPGGGGGPPGGGGGRSSGGGGR